MNYFYVFIGGGFGSVIRYILSNYITQNNTSNFPYATFFINILGSFLIGTFWSIFSNENILDDKIKSVLFIGILGGFTTFSTFSLENIKLLNDGYFVTTFIYILLSVILGLIACFIGYYIFK